MKLLVIILIAANVATYFWFQQTYSQSAADPLLENSQEYSSDGRALATIRMLHEPEIVEPVLADASSANSVGDEFAVKPGMKPAAKQLPPSAKQTLAASAAGKMVSAAQSNESAGRTIPDAADSKVVASQSPALTSLDRSDRQTQKLPNGLCWFLDIEQGGKPTSKSNGLNEIGEYLGSLGIQSELVEVKIPKPLRYIVYIPAKDSKAEAITELRRLLADGYDAFVFREGKYKNAISLGLYNNKRIAENMLGRFSSEGLDAKLSPWESFRFDSRLRLDGDSSGKLASGLWSALEDRWDGAQREKKYCNAIASR